MFNHIMLGASDLERAKVFYDATLGVLGVKPGTHDRVGRLVYVHDGGILMLTKPIDGAPATGANGGTIGFKASTSADADAWHTAGMEHGGAAIEDPPGVRPGGKLYLAYLLDPDGNKLCALYRMPV